MFSLKDYPGGEYIRTLADLDVESKRVFLRVDFNVPIKNGVIKDDTRIKAALPTISALLEKGAKVICASHLGRPKGKVDPTASMEVVADKLGELLGKETLFSHECVGHAVQHLSKELKAGQILVLENLRFHPGEESNSVEFATKLSHLCDAYVNDAFGTCHRAHASVQALPAMMQNRAAGFLLEKEISALGALMNNPQRPMGALLGGAKVSDKIKVIETFVNKCSKIFIGGAMAYTFLRALNVEVGESRVEPDKIDLCKKLLKRAEEAHCKIFLPVDHKIGNSFDNPGPAEDTINAHIPAGKIGLDIGPKTCELYKKELIGLQTLFWNGPMGVFEKPPFDTGTLAMARALADLPIGLKICGGGDSVAAVNQMGLSSAFHHISTGGGASLEMIEGAPMPGIDALKIYR
ncbi:MAG: phosphoglycerate kinase [Proteobacteria bacterium]|nr:phosphoglycerate kinase [Pseudomonadota bacterium]